MNPFIEISKRSHHKSKRSLHQETSEYSKGIQIKPLPCYQWIRVDITGPVRLIIETLDQEWSSVVAKRPHYLSGVNKDLNARANLFKSRHQTVKDKLHRTIKEIILFKLLQRYCNNIH